MREEGAAVVPKKLQHSDDCVYDHFSFHLNYLPFTTYCISPCLQPLFLLKRSLVQYITPLCSFWAAGRKDLCNLWQRPWAMAVRVGDSPEEGELKRLLSSRADWHSQSDRKVSGGAAIPLAASTFALDKEHCLTFFRCVFHCPPALLSSLTHTH